jgi:hypothetical protein
MVGVFSKTGQSVKQTAQQVARQMAREPLEILREAKGQTGETVSSPELRNAKPQESLPAVCEEKLEGADKLQSERTLKALENEIADIRRQKIFKDLQAKITAGQEVYLNDVPELTEEEKAVLKAQIEAVKLQKASSQQVSAAPQISSRPSRRLFSGKKQGVKQERQRVENVKPLSG